MRWMLVVRLPLVKVDEARLDEAVGSQLPIL
jgi:hypothetical protein